MTLWSRCFAFGPDDLSHIKAPGADLSGGIFYGTNFRKADLRGCRIT